MPGPQPARRRSGIATALAVCCLVLAVPGWASAQTEPLLDDPLPPPDTVTKTVKDVLEPVRETVKPVTDTVDPVTKTVDEAVKPVTDKVRDVTEPVREVVDPVTEVVDPVTDVVDPDPRQPDPRPPTGGNDGETVVPPPPGRTTTATPDRRDQAAQTALARRREGLRRPAPVTSVLPGSLRKDGEAMAVPRPAAPAIVATPVRQSVPDAIARAVVDASRAFRFPLLLAAAMLLFLAIQSRLDARDPKLAQTAVEQELTFA